MVTVNAEWIAGYGNDKFGPSGKVTGCQAAAVILRAVGYGKNNEFKGGFAEAPVEAPEPVRFRSPKDGLYRQLRRYRPSVIYL